MDMLSRLGWAVVLAGALAANGCGDDGDSTPAEEGSAGSTADTPTSGSPTETSGTGPTSPSTTDTPTTGTPPTTEPTTEDSAEDSSGGDDDSSTSAGDGVDVIELRAGGFSPPPVETYYSCFSFTFEVDALHHIIGFEPVVDSPLVHHYVLSIADGNVQTDPNDPCFEWPADILWAWSPGMGPMMLPEEAGLLLGDAPGGQQTFVLQVHYNDPLGQGIEDNNGVDILVTEDLRPNTAAIFSQGDIGSINIPGGEAAYEHTAECSGALTTNLLDEPINVFSTFLHAHELGAAITTDILRDGEVVGTMAEDPFDFNAQRFLEVDVTVEPGDTIQTRCTYDSSGVQGSTPGGVASNEEMCINFMMYYPKVEGRKCGSI